MDNFTEYMWYLLTSPFKKVKKQLNHWYTLCTILGRRFDESKESVLRARDEGMITTCSDDMLSIHGADRRLTRYTGEHSDNFRARIAMYGEICQLGGLNEGIILAVKSLGYTNPIIQSARDFVEDEERWAEFYLIIVMDMDEEHPIGFEILRKTVRQWKEVGAKDNYYMEYTTSIYEPHTSAFPRIKFRKFIYFYDYLKTDGKWQLDGTYDMDSVVHEFPVTIGFCFKNYYSDYRVMLSNTIYKYSQTTQHTSNAHMGFRTYANYFEAFYLKTNGDWQLDGTYNMDNVIHIGRLMWMVKYIAEHIEEVAITQRYKVKSVEHVLTAQKSKETHRLTVDYFDYQKLNGLWMLTGSRYMNSRRNEYNTTEEYRLKVEHKEEVTVTWHEEHNLFFLDGEWQLDGSKIIDAYQKTEVM